jgi:hypothetical protein
MFNFAKLRKLPKPSDERVEALQTKFKNYLQLPAHVSPETIALANNIAHENENWFGQANAIANYLRVRYPYDLDVPATPKGKDAVEDFLFTQKRGYCEHFASAFVVLCRTKGIPARLVTGFLPGEYNALTGLWEVRMHDAHAWAEVFVPQAGWVPFDPTPGGLPPGFSGFEKQPAFDYLVERIRPFVMGFFNQPQIKEAWQAVVTAIGPAAEKAIALAWNIWTPLIVGAGVVATVGFGLHFLLSRRRKRALTARSASESASIGGSDESRRLLAGVLSDLEKLDLMRHPSETVNELAQRACQHLDTQFACKPEQSNEDQIEGNSETLKENIADFSIEYSLVRFGRHNETRRLAKTAENIHTEVQRLLTAK